VVIGNQAIARGLVEAGLEIAAAYPGTPSSEILPGVVYFKNMEGLRIHTEWSTNELCAFEVAFGAAAYGGARAACFMKQVGLNVAFPALMRSREKSIEGGLVIVSCDDPGPQSSQTEQDTRLIAALFGIPVFDPSSPAEAADVAYHALTWSFENKVPVIIRSTHRVSHARESVPLYHPGTRKVILKEGHVAGAGRKLGIVASGMSCSLVYDVIEELGASDEVSLYKVLKVYPVDDALGKFVDSMERVLVVEETDQVIEALIGDARKVMGRRDGTVPSAGEITYDIVRDILSRVLAGEGGSARDPFVPDGGIEEALSHVAVVPRPPKLCPGCPHRASFFAMQYLWPDAIYPGDIGCYTLGISQGAVDTCLDMGAGVTLAEGFYDAFNQDGKLVPILASIGDSTFLHACMAPLYDAVKNRKRFILVIMDNSTTAMTGMQPTPQTGITVDGTATRGVAIEDIVQGLGVNFVRVVDPYDVPAMIRTIGEAFDRLKEEPLPAVVIARRECLLLTKGAVKDAGYPADIERDCIGCKSCLKTFDCPAMSFDEASKKIRIDDSLCTNCGICYYACPVQREGKGSPGAAAPGTP